ncbi:MAG TPA: chromosome segregation protein SMC [Metalysinibacillus jejuensis]|uniref:Chromosome partition protein Smc n=1 Tax=Metalysinibacillus jejuensis TaxID=914327 RepID=A0A921T4V8_9BACL|nr:chromosome segregation protein SMC [Metalysinibacillus jejuensis]
MYLKRLDMVGFKSFAKRTSIDFVPGLTAVVGPNGSGKSNVTDAIRWVLGEQSAKSLRGAKMEDIIFSGSDAHRSVNVAEVTLILDNSDERVKLPYNEVSVTRRVHRSGESEYLLNNQACRLKDITDLFMDSGLGKEAFSIISQGRVDEILNSRPQDRRAIFEEAAGVLKYKLRKKKAQHKLFETSENLLRVLDISKELALRLQPLEEQAAKARDYLQMTEDVKEYDIAVMVADATNHLTAMQEAKQLVDNYEGKALALANQIEEIESELSQLTAKREEMATQYDVVNATLMEASTEVERLTGYQAVSAEKEQNRKQRLDDLTKAKQTLREQLLEWQDKKQQANDEYAKHQQQMKAYDSQIKQFEHVLQRSVKELEQEIEIHRNHYIDLKNEQVAVQNDKKHIEQQIERHQTTDSRVRTQTDEASHALLALTERYEEVSVKYEQLTQLKNSLTAQLTEKRAVLLDQQTKTDNKQKMLFEAYQHQHRLKTRKETLEELAADFSGFYQGVRAVLQARDEALTGIDGAVAELIHVPKQYTEAIETALGAASQHIITTDERAAQQAIHYLKRKKEGRATFLPRTVIQPRFVPADIVASIKAHPAFIQIAASLVKVDEKYARVVQNLLGGVIVARDLEGATAIARIANFRYRVVTLDGDVVNTGGSLTGGAAKRQSNVFSRKTELEELAVKLSTIVEQITKAEQDVQQSQQRNQTLKEQVVALTQQLEEVTRQAYETQTTQTALQNDKKHLQARVTSVTTTQNDTEQQLMTLSNERQKATARIETIEQQLLVIDQQVKTLLALKEKSETERDSLRQQLDELRPKFAVTKEKRNQASELVAQCDVTIAKLQKEVTDISSEITWFTTQANEQDAPQVIAQKIAHSQTLKQQSEAKLVQLRQQRQENEQTIQQRQETLREIRLSHQSYNEQLHNSELKMEREKSRIIYIEQQLLEQYDWDLRSQQDVPVLTIDLEQARRRVKLLKQSIEELGTVNVNAIAEYAEVSERYRFLEAQRQDLLEAQQTLNDAIEEMDSEMTARFKTTFEEIRTHFHAAFRELFGGGKADLVLIDPTNLLETGIEIIAQPPGKKLQNLSLLSGGERALVAIAILFAILKTRPVPFCVLDEVEAALDEANVTRYVEYLRKLSDDTQFIVITHRKGTMEGADVLYGITMQESGISKLVSVKLEQYEEERS